MPLEKPKNEMKIIKLKNFWKNKKVFITGHTGFKGAWLCIFLNLLGAKIYGFSLKEESNSLFHIVKKKLKLKNNIYGNIGDYKKLNNILKKVNPHIVFHFAAQSIVQEGYSNSRNTFENGLRSVTLTIEVTEHRDGSESGPPFFGCWAHADKENPVGHTGSA